MSKKGIGKFVLGASLGAGLALLFAPKKGSDLRRDIKRKLDDFMKDVDKLTARGVCGGVSQSETVYKALYHHAANSCDGIHQCHRQSVAEKLNVQSTVAAEILSLYVEDVYPANLSEAYER